MNRFILSPVIVLAFALTSCTATSNPDRGDMKPIAPVVAENASAASPSPVTPSESSTQAAQSAAGGSAAASNAAAQAKDESATAQTKNDAATPPQKPSEALRSRALGSVGGRPITAEDILIRLWTADNRRVRDAVEQLVFAELAMLEADRLTVRLEPGAVDAAFARARATLERKHADSGSTMTFEQYIDRVLEREPKRYLDDLRSETVVQLLAERCVRAWATENGSAEVRITEIRDPGKLELAKADLAAGKSFDEIALAHGFGDDEEKHWTAMTLVRAESQELSRVVFATPIGSIGGPVEQSGRWLYISVDARTPGREGGWTSLGADIEQGLTARAVENLEFMQWLAAMRRRYRVELAPFYEFVEPRRQ